MPWKFDNNRSIYVQLVEKIQNRIITGVYAPGSRLASVRELAGEAEVNPNTMQKALAELERAGTGPRSKDQRKICDGGSENDREFKKRVCSGDHS